MNKKNIAVATVTEIKGTFVVARMYENTNSLTYFYDGVNYHGVGINEYVGINRGPYKLVGKVSREFAEDQQKDPTNQTFSIRRFTRDIEINIVGAFINNEFQNGVSVFPQIFAEVILLSNEEITKIITGNVIDKKFAIKLGHSVPDNVPFQINWSNFFNKHFAIFGNTGSGKSNTLTKIYTELFKKQKTKKLQLNKSKFIFLDFNGEYVLDNVLSQNKKTIRLDTRKESGEDKLEFPRSFFWDVEMLSILFSATKQTQEPFLRNTIDYFKPGRNGGLKQDDLCNFIISGFEKVFLASSPNKHSLSLLNTVIDSWCESCVRKTCLDILLKSFWDIQCYKINNPKNPGTDQTKLAEIRRFFDTKNKYIELKISDDKEKRKAFIRLLKSILSKSISKSVCDSPLLLLKGFVNLELIHQLQYGDGQFDFIFPLISRINSKINFFDKILKIGSEPDIESNFIFVISLRNVNSDAKEIVPLLLSKYLYSKQKESVKSDEKVGSTTHLIIDEAHNILSTKSVRETDNWRDYRLDVFEEIIKEGRKFGFYLTISSQRPADISQTIVSQMHNYIIHRLVNENDLRMLDSSLSYIDSTSRASIPSLAPGVAIFTGINFPLPLIVKVDELAYKNKPNSENANLKNIWIPKDKNK